MKEKFMLMAIDEARRALNAGEVPVGAVIVKDGVVISKAYNMKESKKQVTGHAEILAIEDASKKMENWRLNGCDIYVTLEPCPMCASAIKQARISNLYYGLSNKDENNKSLINMILKKDIVNPSVNIDCGYFEFEIASLMSEFFEIQRVRK